MNGSGRHFKIGAQLYWNIDYSDAKTAPALLPHESQSAYPDFPRGSPISLKSLDFLFANELGTELPAADFSTNFSRFFGPRLSRLFLVLVELVTFIDLYS